MQDTPGIAGERQGVRQNSFEPNRFLAGTDLGRAGNRGELHASAKAEAATGWAAMMSRFRSADLMQPYGEAHQRKENGQSGQAGKKTDELLALHGRFYTIAESVQGRPLLSCKIPPMLRSPVFRIAVLLVALAFLLPLAVVACSCTDCFWSTSLDCCPPSCCSCCVHSPSVVTASVWAVPHPALIEAEPNPPENSYPSFRSLDIFHVPKPSLV